MYQIYLWICHQYCLWRKPYDMNMKNSFKADKQLALSLLSLSRITWKRVNLRHLNKWIFGNCSTRIKKQIIKYCLSLWTAGTVSPSCAGWVSSPLRSLQWHRARAQQLAYCSPSLVGSPDKSKPGWGDTTALAKSTQYMECKEQSCPCG